MALSCLVFAGPIGSVTRVEGATITVNRGKDQQITPGTRLFVLRAGKSLAEVEVSQVSETSSQARVVRVFGGEAVLAGDIVATEAGASGESPSGATLPTGVAGPTSRPAVPTQFRPLPLDLTLESAEQSYREAYESRTHHKDFRQVVTNARGYEQMMPGMGLMNVYMTADLLATSFGPGGFYGDPSYLLMTAWQAIEQKRQRDKIFDAMDVKLQVEVTVWDLELLERYGQYSALVNGFSETQKYQAFMKNLAAQKGLAGGRVFEIRLRNKGQIKAQLAPFNWHIFMVGPNQSRVGATRYDATLDRQVDPGHEVSGNVYFPMVPSSGSSLQVILEDIYGDRGEMEFSLDRN